MKGMSATETIKLLESAVAFALRQLCPEFESYSNGSIALHRRDHKATNTVPEQGPTGPEYHCTAPERVFWAAYKKQRSSQNITEKQESTVELSSDHQLLRRVTLAALAKLLCDAMADWPSRSEYIAFCAIDTSNSAKRILINTVQTAAVWQAQGLVGCAICGRFVKAQGSGMEWHMKRMHTSIEDHESAYQAARVSVLALSLVYSEPETRATQATSCHQLPITNESNSLSNDEKFLELCRSGDVLLVKHMVTSGVCDPKLVCDRHGSDPLMWSAGEGNLEVCKYLVNECAMDPIQPIQTHHKRAKRGYAGRLALHWAARNGQKEVLKWLIETCKVDVNLPTRDGTTPFALASNQGRLEVCKYLIQVGADPKLKNSYGCNASMWATQGIATIDFLAFLKDEAQVSFDCLNDNGQGCLHKAAQRGHMEIVKWLIQDANIGTMKHFSPNAAERSTPSQLAMYGGFTELAEYLRSLESQVCTS